MKSPDQPLRRVLAPHAAERPLDDVHDHLQQHFALRRRFPVVAVPREAHPRARDVVAAERVLRHNEVVAKRVGVEDGRRDFVRPGLKRVAFGSRAGGRDDDCGRGHEYTESH